MNVLLLYYTGTFNTRYLTLMLKKRFESEGHSVTTYEIDPLNTEKLSFDGYDLLGLGFPIYGFNAPYPFLKFVKKQKFPKGMKAFIYKNSGETFHANDASSVSVLRKLKKDGVITNNEYHFIMPYNIHFRFEENLVKEMLEMDDKLLDILYYEVTNDIKNIKKYKLIHRIITFFVKLQFIGGDVNSFFCHVDKKKCTKCGYCIKMCPMKNIFKNKKGDVRFHHHCLMCMRCSLGCPVDAVRIGLLEGWRVNGPYNFEQIRKIENKERIINENTKGFFRCYIETYKNIDSRYEELFGEKK
ncbi:MAG: EFR1 family ferrodoxin [Bacilli bacterium]|nr:EFR1 family ferrodoxin [Bacilli bacterium]